MAQQYISINVGKDGFKDSDFTTGTSSTAGDDIELRYNDATVLSKKQLIIALEALERRVISKATQLPKI
ncbi:MAG: hypothetical protein E6Q97_28360 [Desulfurellales bacterium]|nr:MAG: hypothetical protein E6Q97_28360 [Desulfurellales bacterium]